ncbi:hypothetical protein ACMFMG_002205 [Clarireedia jacksonii]
MEMTGQSWLQFSELFGGLVDYFCHSLSHPVLCEGTFEQEVVSCSFPFSFTITRNTKQDRYPSIIRPNWADSYDRDRNRKTSIYSRKGYSKERFLRPNEAFRGGVSCEYAVSTTP